MAATIFLIRHATHDRVDSTLCGRMDGVRLSDSGHAQARRLADRLRRGRLDAVYTSPLERARQTAAYLAPASMTIDALTEVDYGAWTGRAFAELAGDPHWQAWNTQRDTARPPGGESIAEAQARAGAALEAVRERHAEGRVAVVSHAEILKSVIGGILRLAAQSWALFDIAPASISVVALWAGGGKILQLNETVPA
jgi:probable phosphoglycerate mutase